MPNKIIIAKDGFDVLSETDVDNQIFNSDYDTLKYHAFGEVVVTTDLSDYYYVDPSPLGDVYFNRTIQSISHGLGYAPHFRGYIGEGLNAQLPFSTADAFSQINIRMYADTTNLYIVIDESGLGSPSGTIDRTFTYRIFRNRLGL